MRKVYEVILSTALLLSSAASAVAVTYSMPTPSKKVTSKFGYRWGREHKGLDIKVQIGDTIRAAFDGEVVTACYNSGGYGYYVALKHEKGFETRYAHLSKFMVKIGQRVKAGDPIGLGGNTGRSTGPHLHFEIRKDGVALNPAAIFDFPNQALLADYHDYETPRAAKKRQKAEKRLRKMSHPADTSQVRDSMAVRPLTLPVVVTGKRQGLDLSLVSLGIILLKFAKDYAKTKDSLISPYNLLPSNDEMGENLLSSIDETGCFEPNIRGIHPPPI